MTDVDHTRDLCDQCGDELAMPVDSRQKPEHTCAGSPIIRGNWASLEDLFGEWTGAREELSKPGTTVLYADYDTPSYEGYAVCVFERDGKLYEVNCSHCSCYGLENFTPEETNVGALLARKHYGTEFTADFRKILEARMSLLPTDTQVQSDQRIFQ